MDEGKKRILIIEDELPMLKALSDKFTDLGFSVTEAKDGEEGLRVAQTALPDLILLDVIMPKMDGISMIKKLRENDWGKTVPVVILTNVSADSNATINAVVETQPAYYLMKTDMTLDGIVEKVKSVLRVDEAASDKSDSTEDSNN